MMRRRTIAFPAIRTAGIALVVVLVVYWHAAAAQVGPTDPLVSSPTGLAAWWADGRLAGPVAVAVYALAWGLGHLGKYRVRWLAWLRWGRVRSVLALSASTLFVLLPSAAAGSLTWGGLIGALCAGTMALPSGGHETPPTRESDGVPT